MNIRQIAKSFAIGLVVSLALAGVVLAHHGRAGYANEIQTVKGTVADVQWKNPHVFIGFDVKDDKGNVVHWLAELSSPATMLAAGMSRTTLKTGDEVVIKGKLGVDSPIVLVDSITRDGKPVVGDPNAEGRFVNSTR
ncbi:MAG: hypothetical protein AUG08_15620 [Acidobacteria bacterium 13_1_20CM_2_55_15]|nr:MAG: hypothetical protein AUI91_01745 [Acidobacteria bacterium 13_1_40CM_3_56_11]OLE86140.1 MAG: hypothetical protein AUG08_15620 [Acidobacteria bacterium 13_1_20CM_2_55_15]PYR70483.1 MAG: hypothetical protein DMG20_05275 [Acidobacteriota bacterium]PYR85371.1 MAG: hypothetical protein DMG18_06305 [Acidobacteriota bacterium]PYR89342.1 MAG: hypothetical protein DMG19_07300 [Acidobacteriota bacterium]